jgi:hypothetical protein
MASSIKLQSVVDNAQAFGDLTPIFNVGGQTNQPALTIASDVMSEIVAQPFPFKWNEIVLPVFYTNSFQQDYAGINTDGSSITNLNWLERGIVVDINNTALPKPSALIETGRQLPQATGGYYNTATQQPMFKVNWFPNSTLYYGVWGDADTGNGSLGNNPVAGSVYTNPLGAGSMPSNPYTQIQDANGNFLVLTTYGTEGSAAPLAAPSAAAGTVVFGTGATTRWTVVDPSGSGFRILPPPSQTGVVWQFNLIAQMKPTRFTGLSQTLDPLPDIYESNFRQGFIAQCYRYSPEAKIRAKFPMEWQMWKQSLISLRAEQDREQEENGFTLGRGIMGRARSGWAGPAWPFNGPVTY